MTKPDLTAIARDEARRWPNVPKGVVIAILFAYVLRITTGKTYEETFFPSEAIDYQI